VTEDDPASLDNSAWEDQQNLVAQFKKLTKRHGEAWARVVLKHMHLRKGRRKGKGQEPLLVAYDTLTSLDGLKPSIRKAVQFSRSWPRPGLSGKQNTLERRLRELLAERKTKK